MMRFSFLLAPLMLLSACAVPVGPVEVSRFHVADASPLGHGTIAVVPGPGMDGASLEWQSYQIAVERELSALGYTPAPPDSADQIAAIRLVRTALTQGRSPVGVSIGASGSNYGSGAGVGISFPIGAGSGQQTATDLIAMIRTRADGKTLWEGRASFTVSAASPLAQTQLAAPKLAQALFTGFPGQSGETIRVP
ncbi:DUF4136 domain-containing protein [Novosphingobium sp. KACC 22771]|uniref:DUF4136 domain-containing protein n=1 Tax=Novosphingobium sp. KACC 22771 TaxID=3025670 RepID=UPI002365BBA4|nr:DUF4136 domain-containing protein [Novosphingobium sp. KACC 22771]WDF72199.1 DUF4136 domain-containing protein [Novosphingobium sp. KACC 22771]